MELMKDIQEAVKKALPAHLSEELQHVLQIGKAAMADVDKLRKENAKLQTEVDRLKPFELRDNEVRNRSTILDAEKQKFEVDKRDYKITVLEQKYTDVRTLMHDVFRNQRIVYQASTSKYVQGHSTPQGWVSDHTETDTQTTEKLEE